MLVFQRNDMLIFGSTSIRELEQSQAILILQA